MKSRVIFGIFLVCALLAAARVFLSFFSSHEREEPTLSPKQVNPVTSTSVQQTTDIQAIETRPLVGTLTIVIPRLFILGNCWVYINGQLQAAKPAPDTDLRLHAVFLPGDQGIEWWDQRGVAAHVLQRLGEGKPGVVVWCRSDFSAQRTNENLSVQVPPGSYKVELAVETRWVENDEPDDLRFPFTFVSQDATLGAGETVCVWTSPPPWGGLARPAAVRADPIIDTVTEEHVIRAWFEEEAKRIDEKLRSLEQDPVMQALLTAMRLPCTSPTATIDLPGTFGGRREFDAKQVRMIGSWLSEHLWSWFGHPYGTVFEKPDMRARWQQLETAVSSSKRAITKATDDFAKRLEEAQRSP